MIRQLLLSFWAITFFAGAVVAQGVGINTLTPDPSAILDVASSSKGFLPPRMTQVERDAISAPAYGLMILNTTTDCINLYVGGWRQICSECDFSAPTAGNNGPICEGSTLNLLATTISGATYDWTGPNGFTSSSQNPSISSATTAASGTYSVTATLNGCTSSSSTTFVTVNEIPSAPTAGSNSPVCKDSTLSLTASSVPGGVYNWTGPDAYSGSGQNPLIDSMTVAKAGVYEVTVSVNGCASPAASTTVVVDTIPPAPGSISGAPIVCANTNGVAYSISAVAGASSYTWAVPSGATIASGQGTTAITVDFTTASGNICVTADNYCSSSPTSCIAVNAGQYNTGSQAYAYSGSDVTFTVPAGVTALQVKLWGAGGGGGTTSNSGGPGGYVEGSISVTPGANLTLQVGSGGHGPCSGDCSGTSAFAVYPGGNTAYEGNAGGGYTGLFDGSTPLLIAGAGGGGGGGNNGTNKRGGAGGSTTAQDGDDASSGGKGGNQSAGGAAGSGPGSSTNGGYLSAGSAYYGGSGGSGYYGGGGGNRAGSWLHMGGGGGSSYIISSAVCTQNLIGDKAAPSTVPNSADSDYTGTIGRGGQGGFGGHGRAVIRW